MGNYGPAAKKAPTMANAGFDENAWDQEEGDYAPMVVDLEEDDEEIMDVDVNFEERSNAGAHMDMKTGKMVFSS